MQFPGVVPRLTQRPGSVRTLGPALGAHTAEILGQVAGLDADELAELAGEGVV